MSFRALVRKLFAPKPGSPIRRRPALGLSQLEAREVPAIALIDGVLTITGNNFADTVTITGEFSIGGGSRPITVVHSGFQVNPRPGGAPVPFTETRTFNPRREPIVSVRAELGNGNNTFTNNSMLPSVAIGGWGEDVFVGGTSADIFLGAGGDDELRGGLGMDILAGGDGEDDIKGGSGDDALYGDAGDDRIEGGNGNDDISGGSGDDEVYGQDGSDVIRGEGGFDFLNAGDGNNTVYGGSGNDVISAGSGTDELYGEGGNDDITAGGGQDRVDGGYGNDTLRGGGGADDLWGGAGNDTLVGGDGDDALEGDAGADVLYGSAGDDFLRGGDGDNEMFGENGDDRLIGGTGNDSLDGGSGNDELSSNNGNDTLRGGTGNDSLDGGSGSDSLFGGDGKDDLDGGSGNDLLYGDTGNDLLYGDTGNDLLYGGAGIDRLFGGGDLDYLDGGTGSDRFLQRVGFEDAILSVASADVVVRFQNSPDEYTRSDGETYASATWSDDEIFEADKALGILHVTTGNAQLLKRDGEGITLRQVGMYLEGEDDDGALGWNDGSPTIFVLDECYDDAVLGIEVVLHEIAHFWDERSENSTANQFRAISGWQPLESALPSGYSKSEDEEWMYLTSSVFTRTYAKTNPKEDFAESFATYWLHQLGLDSAFSGATPFEELGEKMAYMQQFWQQMS